MGVKLPASNLQPCLLLSTKATEGSAAEPQGESAMLGHAAAVMMLGVVQESLNWPGTWLRQDKSRLGEKPSFNDVPLLRLHISLEVEKEELRLPALTL